jgi:hypothetical protein
MSGSGNDAAFRKEAVMAKVENIVFSLVLALSGVVTLITLPLA